MNDLRGIAANNGGGIQQLERDLVQRLLQSTHWSRLKTQSFLTVKTPWFRYHKFKSIDLGRLDSGFKAITGPDSCAICQKKPRISLWRRLEDSFYQ